MATSTIPRYFINTVMSISNANDLNDYKTSAILHCSYGPDHGVNWDGTPGSGTGYLNTWYIVFGSGSAALQVAIYNPASSNPFPAKARQYYNSQWSDWKDISP